MSVRPPIPNTPTNVTAVAGSDRVTLSWQMQPQGQTGFIVIGPGAEQGRTVAASATTVGITGVPFGTHTWIIAPYWDTPFGRRVEYSTGASISATVRQTRAP